MSTPPTDDFESLFPTLLRPCFGVAYRILGDERLAEDAATEALARAHLSWSKIANLSHRDAWLAREAAAAALDIARKQTELSPLRVALITALRSLPRRQRETVVLLDLEHLPEPDIAACLGITIGTLRDNAAEAHDALRRLLGEDWSQDLPVADE